MAEEIEDKTIKVAGKELPIMAANQPEVQTLVATAVDLRIAWALHLAILVGNKLKPLLVCSSSFSRILAQLIRVHLQLKVKLRSERLMSRGFSRRQD